MSETVETSPVWTLILEPRNEGGKPDWAAWVAEDEDDEAWGVLRIIHIPTKTVVLTEDVSLRLDLTSFIKGRCLEDQWDELVRNWIAAREHDEEYAK